MSAPILMTGLLSVIMMSQSHGQTLVGQLESPQANSAESGIGLIRGWVCSANQVTVQVDQFPVLTAGYGTSRADTAAVCGDSNNGFGLTINWNLFGQGAHTLRALVDGVLLAEVPFKVTTLGENFVTGASGVWLLPGFPAAGQSIFLQWSEAHQNFIFTELAGGRWSGSAGNVSTGLLESPQVGSAESGVGLIRGWFCNARAIDIQLDALPRFPAAYGTPREDTVAVCGDSNNGFGITFNWNLLGNGLHTARAFADGVEFAQVQFQVSTLGVKFLTGVQAQSTIANFPAKGTDLTLSWSEAHQNFVITNRK